MRLLGVAIWILIRVQVAWAGPPFATDDPEPVDYRHWEVYVASQLSHDKGGWTGTAPHFEVNYGAIPNLQLHLIAPVSFAAPVHEATQFGYGDTELGVKYRFFEETDYLPQVGVFPLIEAPTGDHKRGLGSGHVQAFIPLWLQKSFDPWTTYGGGGYWINPGNGNLDWWFVGWLLQRNISPNLTLGAEIFHETPSEIGGRSDSKFNLGGIYNLSQNYHLLFSAGHTMQGPSAFQAYFAFQFTFGPEKQTGSKN
jgi:hypothetical protein